jgi:hypothetical protein
MPASKSSSNQPRAPQKAPSSSTSTASHLDILFSGPLLLVPGVKDGSVTSVEVFSPCNGHPIGAVFLPGVVFSDAELNDPQCARWPAPESFSLLDAHSFAVELNQNPPGVGEKPFPVKDIPSTNHKVKPGRRLSADWDVSVTVHGRLSGWGSVRLSKVTKELYMGGDAPTGKTIAAMHRLRYEAVTAAEFCGATATQKEYLRSNISKGGTLIVLGEIPYQSSLLHERLAIDALAKLAGLDLHLVATDPSPHKTRLMAHTQNCGHSIVLA